MMRSVTRRAPFLNEVLSLNAQEWPSAERIPSAALAPQ